jgi:threonine/homoserine/homoserine lactone efflux protein
MARALALGVLVGFPIAASPGPMFVLIIRRTLARGWRSGFVSGLGVASGDASYAALAAFGVAAVTNLLVAERRWISLAGGIGLIAIGVRTVLESRDPLPDPPHKGEGNIPCAAPTRGREISPVPLPQGGREISPARLPRGGREIGLAGSYFSTLALTLSNPPTILSFTAIFAGFGLRVGRGWLPAVGLVLGVTVGSAVWWGVLVAGVSVVRERLTPSIMRGIGVVSGLVLIAFGGFAAVSAR